MNDGWLGARSVLAAAVSYKAVEIGPRSGDCNRVDSYQSDSSRRNRESGHSCDHLASTETRRISGL